MYSHHLHIAWDLSLSINAFAFVCVYAKSMRTFFRLLIIFAYFDYFRKGWGRWWCCSICIFVVTEKWVLCACGRVVCKKKMMRHLIYADWLGYMAKNVHFDRQTIGKKTLQKINIWYRIFIPLCMDRYYIY